jgi:predicted nucleic acid-binding protein
VLATAQRCAFAFTVPLSIEAAVDRVRGWLERRQVTCFVPGSRHLEIAFGLLKEVGASGNLTTHAQIVAHALEHNAEVHTNDGDFGRLTVFVGSTRSRRLAELESRPDPATAVAPAM